MRHPAPAYARSPNTRQIAEVMLERLRNLDNLDNPDPAVALGYAQLAAAEALWEILDELKTINFHLSNPGVNERLPFNQEERRLLIKQVMEPPQEQPKKLTGYTQGIVDALATLGRPATAWELAKALGWPMEPVRGALKRLKLSRIIEISHVHGRTYVYSLARPELASVPMLPPP